MNNVFFKEEQRYKKPRILYIIAAVTLMLLIDITFLIREIIAKNNPAIANGSERVVLIIVTILLTLFTAGFLFVFLRKKLVTVITQNGLDISYPPLHTRARKIAKDEIERFEVREYNPILEYGGWGIKPRGRLLRRKRSGEAFTAYGKTGVQLYLHGGNKILIGTQRPEPFKYAHAKILDQRNEKG